MFYFKTTLQKNKLTIIVGALAFFVASACNPSTTTVTGTGERSTETPVDQPEELEIEQYCYEKIYSYQDGSNRKDKILMTLFFRGEEVTGAYHWLPAEKDQRRGKLEGTRSGERMTVQYTFMQEGREQTVPLEIRLTDAGVVIEGGEPALGLGATLEEVECTVIKDE